MLPSNSPSQTCSRPPLLIRHAQSSPALSWPRSSLPVPPPSTTTLSSRKAKVSNALSLSLNLLTSAPSTASATCSQTAPTVYFSMTAPRSSSTLINSISITLRDLRLSQSSTARDRLPSLSLTRSLRSTSSTTQSQSTRRSFSCSTSRVTSMATRSSSLSNSLSPRRTHQCALQSTRTTETWSTSKSGRGPRKLSCSATPTRSSK